MKHLAISLVLLTCATAFAEGIANQYPADKDIAKDPSVLFADDFESGDLSKWDDKSGTLAVTDDRPNAGTKCAAAPMEKPNSAYMHDCFGASKLDSLPKSSLMSSRTVHRCLPGGITTCFSQAPFA